MAMMRESSRGSGMSSPEAKLGMQVEDLWDMKLEPQLSPTEKLNACFENIPVSAFPPAPSSQVTSKINRDLLKLAKGCGLAASLLTVPSEERDAPTILNYDPTYGGRIRAKVVAKPTEDLPESRRPSKAKPLRGSIRLPTEAVPFEEENMPPRSLEAMLQRKLEEKEKEKNLGNKQKGGSAGASGSVKAPPPPLSQKRSSSASAPTEDIPAPASKRVKTTAKKSSTGGDGVRIGELGAESEGAKEKGKEISSEAVWVPNFVTPDKKQVLRSDSLKEDPSLGFTLHAGLRLPKDIVAPPTLKTALSEYYFHVGRATQSIMSAQLYLTEHDKQTKLLKQRVVVSQDAAEEYKKSLEQSEDARRDLELEITNLKDLVKGLQDSAEQARAEGKEEGLQEGIVLGRKEMEEEMKKYMEEEYNRGYAQAEDDAVDQLVEVQANIKEAQHKKSFLLGFNAGLDEAGVDPTDERRDQMVPPPLPANEVVAEEPPNADPTETPTEQPTDETTPTEA